MRWTMDIPSWSPTPLNKLINSHWGTATKLKAMDKDVIARSKMVGGIPDATCKRRVELLIVHPPGKRFPDPDAFHKSLGDALVHCGLLRNDSHLWVELTQPEFARGESLRTVITLTDL